MPHETIPFASLSYSELRAVYKRLARARGLPGNCGNPSHTKLVERVALLRLRPELPPALRVRKPKPAQRRAMILDTAVRLLTHVVDCRAKTGGGTLTVGHSYPHILKTLRRKHRKARTTLEGLRGIASRIRNGVIVGTLPEIRLQEDPKNANRRSRK